MILKCITIYLIIGWIFEGIEYLCAGGINKFWDEFITNGDYDKTMSQNLIDFATIFSIIIIPFIWPYLIGYCIYYRIKASKHE